MKILGDYITINKLESNEDYLKLRKACIEFERKHNVRLWTIIQENCLETPYNLITTKGLEQLLCDIKENSKMKSLEDIRRLVYSQALMKKWNNTTKFLLDEKLPEEYKEFIEAVKSKNAEHTAKELIDVLYIMVQLFHNLDPKLRINLDEIFKQVHYANWKHKKKTKDENGVWCRR